ncbi:MAG: hypothetical protein AAGA56_16190 [Myxococcota bacterium]
MTRGRWAVVLFTALLVAAGGWVVLFGEAWLRGQVLARAAEKGIAIEALGEVELVGWNEVALRDLQFRFARFEPCEITVERVDIVLDGLAPASLAARGVDVALTGGAVSLLLQLGRLGDAHPGLFSVPIEATDVHVRWWQRERNEPPWLEAKGGSIIPTAQGGRWEARSATIFGVDAGRVTAHWDGGRADASFGFGATEGEPPPVSLRVQHDETPAKLTLDLKPTPLDRLAGPLAVDLLGAKGVAARGKADLSLFEDDRIEGVVTGQLDGYRPPLPGPLASLSFAETTSLRAEVKLDPSWSTAKMRQFRGHHGGIAVDGRATFTRGESLRDWSIDLDVSGSIPCAAIAKAAAESGIGMPSWMGGLAGLAIRGAITLALKVTARTDDFAGAEVRSRLGVGCGLLGL